MKKLKLTHIEYLVITKFKYSHTDKRTHKIYEINIFDDDLKNVLNVQSL